MKKKISTKLDIQNYAKELYCEIDSESKQKYSFREISTKILHKFDKNIHFTTIQDWCEKYQWKSFYEKVKTLGIEKASSLNLEQKEQHILDNTSDAISEIYNDSLVLRKNANKLLNERIESNPELVATRDLVAILNNSENRILILNEKSKPESKELGIQPIEWI